MRQDIRCDLPPFCRRTDQFVNESRGDGRMDRSQGQRSCSVCCDATAPFIQSRATAWFQHSVGYDDGSVSARTRSGIAIHKEGVAERARARIFPRLQARWRAERERSHQDARSHRSFYDSTMLNLKRIKYNYSRGSEMICFPAAY